MSSGRRLRRRQWTNSSQRYLTRRHRGLSLARQLRIERLEARHLLAVFTVTSLHGDGSLGQMIYLANESPGHDTIVFDPAVTGTADQSDMEITDHLTIIGPGADKLTYEGGLFYPYIEDRIFDIDDSDPSTNIDVEISGLRLTEGISWTRGGAIRNRENLKLTECVIDSSFARYSGGAIYSEGGSLTIARSLISGNVSESGTIHSAGGALTITESAIVNSGVYRYGLVGGVLAKDGNVTIDRSLIAGHESPYMSGLLFERCAEVTIVESEISNNSGRGISAGDGNLTIVGSLISGNHPISEGGGGVSIWDGNLTIINSTIDNNISTSYSTAGGVTVDHGSSAITIRIAYSTITGNQAKVGDSRSLSSGGGISVSGSIHLILDHSIIAGNIDHGGVSNDVYSTSAVTTEAHYSLIGDSTHSYLTEAPLGSPDANGNLIGSPAGAGIIDPLLGPLADNGGWTDTHALLPGSPAFNAGNPNAEAGVDGVPDYDQQGFPFDRISGGRIDIGAFEAQVALPALLGDYNHNGKVDGADYTMWRDALGDEVDFYAGADGSGNGKIDEADFLVWRSNFGNTLSEAGGGAAAATLRLADVVPRAVDTPRATPAQRERLRAMFTEQHVEVAADATAPAATVDVSPLVLSLSSAPSVRQATSSLALRTPLAADVSRMDELLLGQSLREADIAEDSDTSQGTPAPGNSTADSLGEPSPGALDVAFEILAAERRGGF